MSSGLSGYRVLVTRAAAQASEFVSRLEATGAEAIVLASIEYEFFEGKAAEAIDQALRSAGKYDAVVVTSARGAEAIEKRLEVLGRTARELVSSRRLVAVGPATAAALARAIREPDLIPSEFSASGISHALGDIAGQRFLLLRADLAKKDLPQWLTERGARVDDVVAYRIIKSREPGAETLAGPAPDFITFTSSSGVSNTLERLTQAGRENWMRTGKIVCLGPVTANTVRELGFEVAAVAEFSTAECLVEALVKLAIPKPRVGATRD